MTKYRTRQELFNNAYHGLASQGWRKSTNRGDALCRYRGAGGLRCALGWSIPDERYEVDLENMTPEQPDILTGFDNAVRCWKVRRAAGIADEDADFACSLQGVHDCVPDGEREAQEMRARLEQFARNHDLTIPDISYLLDVTEEEKVDA